MSGAAARRVPGSPIRRYVPITLMMPLVGSSLGIDGGAVFQILAVENLGLSATAIGIAFGLGVVSLPIQLYAARMPIVRARRNIQNFLLIAAVQAWILAGLVIAGVTGGVATLALGVTVTAEIALSVLYATAWQPLLADGVDTHGRQRLSSRWAAAARGGLAIAVIVFDALGNTGRGVFLMMVGVLAVATAVALNSIEHPVAQTTSAEEATEVAGRTAATTKLLLVVFGAVNIGALPLWLVYLNKVLWPSVNLGIIAAIQTIAAMGALLAWRSTDHAVTGRAVAAAFAILAGAVSITLLDGPIADTAQQATVVIATAVMAAGTTVVRIAMLEAAHRVISPTNTVRAFTLLDVVASTSLQAGLLVGGLLITASASTETWLTDPYRAFVLIASAITIPVLIWFRKAATASQPRAHI